MNSPKANFLFMMADQLRFDAISAVTPALQTTPALDRIASEGLRMEFAYSSTPTCTPARAALLTGRSPWRHGMLGYGKVAPVYDYELPRTLHAAGWLTASVGKDHFGWNETRDTGIDHGYEQLELYDGLGAFAPTANHSWDGEYDNYDRWFARNRPGADPQATLDGLDGDGWNGWHGRAYIYNESEHPT